MQSLQHLRQHPAHAGTCSVRDQAPAARPLSRYIRQYRTPAVAHSQLLHTHHLTQTSPSRKDVPRDSSSSSYYGSSSNSSKKKLTLQQLQQLLHQRPAAEHPLLLTAAIKATLSWQQAAAVFTQHSVAFNHVHTAAMICHLPKVLAQQAPLSNQDRTDVHELLTDLCQLAEEVLPHCSGRELANIAQGLAAAGFYSRRLMQLLLCRCDLRALNPQELANITWAVAKLNHEVHEGWTAEVLGRSYQYMLNPRSPNVNFQNPFPSAESSVQGFQPALGFKPQEMTNVAWALAVMQRQCLLSSAPPLRHSCTRVDAAWKTQFCTAAAAQLASFTAVDIVMSMWALAVLGFNAWQQQWLDMQLQRAMQLLADMQGKHVAVLLWSVSQLQRQQQYWQQQQQRSCAMYLGGSSRSPAAMHAFAAACFSRLQQLLLHSHQQQQQQQHLHLACVVLTSAAHLQLSPPAAVLQLLLTAAAMQLQQQCRSTWEHVLQGGSSSSVSTAGNSQQQQQHQRVDLHYVTVLLYALARIQYRPGQRFMAAAVQAAATACQQQQQHAQHIQVRDIALLLWSFGKLYYQPPPALLKLLYKVTTVRLNACSSSDIGLMFWGLARMRARPRHAWIQTLITHFISRLDDGINTAADVCNIIHALPHLPGGKVLNNMLHNKLLHSGHLNQLAEAAQQRFDQCGPRELVQFVQGFAELGFRPCDAWMTQHDMCCALLREERFSAREQQALAAARAVLISLPNIAPGPTSTSLQQQQQQQGCVADGAITAAVERPLQQQQQLQSQQARVLAVVRM